MAETESTKTPMLAYPGSNGAAMPGQTAVGALMEAYGRNPTRFGLSGFESPEFRRLLLGAIRAQEMRDSLDEYFHNELGREGSFREFICEYRTFPQLVEAVGKTHDRNKLLAAVNVCVTVKKAVEYLCEFAEDSAVHWFDTLIWAAQELGRFKTMGETPKLLANRRHAEDAENQRTIKSYWGAHKVRLRYNKSAVRDEIHAAGLVTCKPECTYRHLGKLR